MPPDQVDTQWYSFDTSAFLNTWRRFYPPDIFPSLWDRIDALVQAGTVIASEEVLVELERKDDEVCDWAKQRREMFISIDQSIQDRVRAILQSHPRLVDTRRNRSGADPFVIALAQDRGCTVVTYEMPSRTSNRPNIPDVCEALGVRWIGFLDFIREQGWTI